ncbi:MAG: hypothetical protein ACTHLD_08260, partial [Chitinophaga sp.]
EAVLTAKSKIRQLDEYIKGVSWFCRISACPEIPLQSRCCGKNLSTEKGIIYCDLDDYCDRACIVLVGRDQVPL